MLSLAISLGHNSSAILLDDGEVKVGYEEERLSGEKADSHFPILSISEIGKYYDLKSIENISVTHWDTYGCVDGMREKYWGRSTLTDLCPNAELYEHGKGFTHHDAHMLSAKAYSGLDGWTIVADGFGNFNEVLSVYSNDVLVHRAFSYDKSLGLLYQYATAFLGMKMNQDEYKLLGYESHIDELSKSAREELDKFVASWTKRYTRQLLSRDVGPKYDALCNIEALPELRNKLARKFQAIIGKLRIVDMFHKRVAIAFFVQGVVEGTLTNIVESFDMRQVTLSGGVFYNVKLNNAIMRKVDHVCVSPLCGDQGAALGVYEYYIGGLVFPKDLCFGIRNLKGFLRRPCLKKLEIRKWSPETEQLLIDSIRENKIVNVVRGNMEYGPRALGNTSTLFLPSIENVDYVNRLNGRNTIMPCAPITTDITQFSDYEKVVNSLAHMIITLDYVKNPPVSQRGAAHKYPSIDKYSGRPQLIDCKHWLYDVVNTFKTLVNTSFNKHGSPILFSEEQIMSTFEYQLERDADDRMLTVIITD